MAVKKRAAKGMITDTDGMFFTIDALIAISIIFGTLYLAATFYIEENTQSQSYQAASDAIKVLSAIKVSEVSNPIIANMIANGTIDKANNTVLEQFGEFWALGQQGHAQTLISEAVGEVASDLKIGVYLEGEKMYGPNETVREVLVSSRKMITGIAKDKPIDGFTSKAFLSSVIEKKSSAYSYFGGFVGQGNVTLALGDLPQGVVIREIILEIDAASPFSVQLNEVPCLSTFTPGSGEMNADSWNLSDCIASINAGEQNNITLQFLGSLGSAYVGGGFVKVNYLTNDLIEEEEEANAQLVLLPEIAGIINLYSSMYVPGTLNAMNVTLHYRAAQNNATNNTIYLTIGNTTVLKVVNASGEGSVILNTTNLSAQLDYSALSGKTIPIRIGFENVSFSATYEGNADVGLITDVSGSMRWRMDQDSVDGTLRNCDDPSYSLGSTRRLSVAKCLDIQFAGDIINISGNKVGLISFSSTTQSADTIIPTTNMSSINATVGTSVPETGYTDGGGTCICCGINSAKALLAQEVGTATIIASGSQWLFSNMSMEGAPAADNESNEWYSTVYHNESSWFSGFAVLGATNLQTYTPLITTEMGSRIVGDSIFADFWERGGDVKGPPADFTSGLLNTSGADYGIGGPHDGWDWDSRNGAGPFGLDDDLDYNQVVGAKLEFDNNFGGAGNRCSNDDCSGSYGISLNITPPMMDILRNGGSAYLSFAYAWDDTLANVFESNDHVWVKARWTSNTSGTRYLGSDLDSEFSDGDASNDIATTDNPDLDFSGTYSAEITQWIESNGTYYLELGGKITANADDEHGTWRFDDVSLYISNQTDQYYLRKHFTLNNTNFAKKGVLNILSDDYAEVYVNGKSVDIDPQSHQGEYWNRRGKPVPGNYFAVGDNVIAVRLVNLNGSAKFDLELLGLNTSREKAMMVMTDGVATEDTGCPQSGTEAEEAIEAACDAREEYGITVYAVGYGEADENTMREIAECGDGTYTTSNNTAILSDFYQDVAQSIVSASRQSQTIEVIGEPPSSILFGDSSIGLNFTPFVSPIQFGEIPIYLEQKNFSNCTFGVFVPLGLRVVDAKLTSYSSEHWTDLLEVNGNAVYNLSAYNSDYTTLGDPFVIDIPSPSLIAGNNTLTLKTGDVYENSTGCSKNTTFLLKGAIPSSVSYTDVLMNASGCRWSVETESGYVLLDVPANYAGASKCSYNSSAISYNPADGTSLATYLLLRNLDFDQNGKIDINIAEQNLQIESIYVSQVPSLWGPTIAEVRVWH